MIYARLRPDGGLETTCLPEGVQPTGTMADMKTLNQDAEVPVVTGLQRIEPHYEETDTQIVTKFCIVENHPKAVMAEIRQLQNTLTASDYKIIKSYEAALMNTEAPYQIVPLHLERQQIRNRINELQNLIGIGN